MIAEQQRSIPCVHSSTPLRAVDRIGDLEHAALCATIRALWRKEHMLAQYSPADELSLNLNVLDVHALSMLKKRILSRLHTHIAAQCSLRTAA